jgi:hypothetical protein
MASSTVVEQDTKSGVAGRLVVIAWRSRLITSPRPHDSTTRALPKPFRQDVEIPLDLFSVFRTRAGPAK